MERVLVSESDSTQRLRKKLEEKLTRDDRHVNPEATTKKAEEIRRQIANSSGSREVITDKRFELFDENHHPAKESRATARKIQEILRIYKLSPQENKNLS